MHIVKAYMAYFCVEPDGADFMQVCRGREIRLDSFVVKISFHPTRINSPWQLNGLDQLSSYGSCKRAILTWTLHFQYP